MVMINLAMETMCIHKTHQILSTLRNHKASIGRILHSPVRDVHDLIKRAWEHAIISDKAHTN